MNKLILIIVIVIIFTVIGVVFVFQKPTTIKPDLSSEPALRPLNKSELKNFLDKPELRPKVEPWLSNINPSVFSSIRYYDNAHLVRDCAQDADDAMTRIKQYLDEIGNISNFSNFKVAEDTGAYFAIEYQVRDKLLKLYLINCNYIKFTSQTLALNTKPTKIANIPRKITEIEAMGYIAFLQQLRAVTGTVIVQQIKQDDAIIKADILRMISIGGDWGLCDSHNSIIDHYEINIDTGDVTYWQEEGSPITGDCHSNPLR